MNYVYIRVTNAVDGSVFLRAQLLCDNMMWARALHKERTVSVVVEKVSI